MLQASTPAELREASVRIRRRARYRRDDFSRGQVAVTRPHQHVSQRSTRYGMRLTTIERREVHAAIMPARRRRLMCVKVRLNRRPPRATCIRVAPGASIKRRPMSLQPPSAGPSEKAAVGALTSRRPFGWIGTSPGVEATDGLLLGSRGHAEKGFPY